MNQNQLIAHIKEHYRITGDHPFSKAPDVMAFRHQHHQKMFCLYAQIPACKLGLTGDTPTAIINIKAKPEMIGSYLMIDGFCPAWHMNKEHWVSVMMDKVDDEMLSMLIAESFQLTC